MNFAEKNCYGCRGTGDCRGTQCMCVQTCCECQEPIPQPDEPGRYMCEQCKKEAA